MPPKKINPKVKCDRCGRFFSVKTIRNHIRSCLVWEAAEDDLQDTIAAYCTSSHGSKLALKPSNASSTPLYDRPAAAGTGLEASPPRPMTEDDFWADGILPEPIELDPNESGDAIEPLRPLEEPEEEPWWVEYAVEEVYPEIVVGEEMAQEFEAILDWMDDGMELELAESCTEVLTCQCH